MNPNKAKISPPDLSLGIGKSFMLFNMLFIALGNMTYNNPSITKSRPMAMPNSFILGYPPGPISLVKPLKPHSIEIFTNDAVLNITKRFNNHKYSKFS